MAREVLVGIVSSPSDAESVVNNLTEQGFSQRTLSVVTANEDDARAIIGDGGPLRGATVDTLAGRLQSLGMSSADAEAYSGAARRGAAVLAIAVSPDTEEAAGETLRTAGAQRIQTIGGGA